MRYFIFIMISLISFKGMCAAPVEVDLGMLKANTLGVLTKSVVFNFYWPQDGSDNGTARLQSSGRAAFAPKKGSVSYRIWGDGKTWLKGTVGNDFRSFHTNFSDIITVNSVTNSRLPATTAGPWILNIHSRQWTSLPATIKGLNSEFTVNAWYFSTKGVPIGKQRDTILTYSESTGYRYFYINYEVVNDVHPECKLLLPNGSSSSDSIYLSLLNAGQERTTNYQIKLQCTDVYQASIEFKMNDVLPNSNGDKTVTVPGGYLQILNDEGNPVKLDGSKPEYIIGSTSNIQKTYSIINNAKHVTKGGDFHKQLNLVVRMN